MTTPTWIFTRYGPAPSTTLHYLETKPVIRPGQAKWFTTADWVGASFAVLDDTDLWLPVLVAQKPRDGAFGRLLTYAASQGWTTHVVSPNELFALALAKLGFTQRVDPTPAGPAEVWSI